MFSPTCLSVCPKWHCQVWSMEMSYSVLWFTMYSVKFSKATWAWCFT
uniref:Uncharacterized protein n=1 Tax=Picea glauca TaxID=3330 RepID=A0A101LTP9_PICGL|nr:hypothetical protein ABT39_MTgene3607 [Picea glauca]